MFPWLFLWAPQVHLPWSGNLSQDIEPHTSWFADLIRPEAGNARIEEQAFGVASYGKQLGHLTDVLIAVAEQGPALPPQAQASLERLRAIREAIEDIKQAEYRQTANRLVEALQAAKTRGGPEYQELAQALLPLLDPSHAARKGA